MNEQEEALNVWRLASRSLVVGAAMCVVAGVLAVGTNMFVGSIAAEYNKAMAARQAAQTALRNTQADKTRLEENLQMFGKLKQSRFAGAPDRLGLLEALESAAKNLRHSTVEWELSPEEKVRPLTDDQTEEVIAHLVRVPMKLSIQGIHEEEWFDLLARLQSTGTGSFVADTCSYERKMFAHGATSVASVGVSCQLSWLYVVAESTAPKPP